MGKTSIVWRFRSVSNERGPTMITYGIEVQNVAIMFVICADLIPRWLSSGNKNSCAGESKRLRSTKMYILQSKFIVSLKAESLRRGEGSFPNMFLCRKSKNVIRFLNANSITTWYWKNTHFLWEVGTLNEDPDSVSAYSWSQLLHAAW